jgi:hypothetical protein
MMGAMRIALLTTTIVPAGMVAILTLARPASACESLPCQSGYLLPRGGTLPQNAPGIVWRSQEGPPSSPQAKPVDVQLWQLAGADKTPAEFSVTAAKDTARGLLVKPKQGWKSG